MLVRRVESTSGSVTHIGWDMPRRWHANKPTVNRVDMSGMHRRVMHMTRRCMGTAPRAQSPWHALGCFRFVGPHTHHNIHEDLRLLTHPMHMQERREEVKRPGQVQRLQTYLNCCKGRGGVKWLSLLIDDRVGRFLTGGIPQ